MGISVGSSHLTSGTGTTTITLPRISLWEVDVAPSGNDITILFNNRGSAVSETMTVRAGDVKSFRLNTQEIVITRAAASAVDIYWNPGVR